MSVVIPLPPLTGKGIFQSPQEKKDIDWSTYDSYELQNFGIFLAYTAFCFVLLLISEEPEAQPVPEGSR